MLIDDGSIACIAFRLNCSKEHPNVLLRRRKRKKNRDNAVLTVLTVHA